jgi:hypothetical protein
MKKSRILQAAVLLLSLSLAACFVAYRAGAWDAPTPPLLAAADSAAVDTIHLDDTMLPSTKSYEIWSGEEASTEAQEPSTTILGSSKSGKIFSGDTPVKSIPAPSKMQKPPHPQPTESGAIGSKMDDPSFLPTSKSGSIFQPEDPGVQGSALPDNHFMGSSKNDGIFEPKPQNDSHRNVPNAVQHNVNAPASTAPVLHGTDDHFMGSSKAAPVFAPAPKVVKLTPAPKNNAQHK